MPDIKAAEARPEKASPPPPSPAAEDPPEKAEAAAPKPVRYVVDKHTSFEINGSTITFRQNQILTDPREIGLAEHFNVPLRELAPLR